jgi:hypothetical protein
MPNAANTAQRSRIAVPGHTAHGPARLYQSSVGTLYSYQMPPTAAPDTAHSAATPAAPAAAAAPAAVTAPAAPAAHSTSYIGLLIGLLLIALAGGCLFMARRSA